MKAQLALPLLALLAAGCGDRVPRNQASGGSTTPPYVRDQDDPSLLGNAQVAVRVGELGQGFAACAARGATRDRPGEAATVPVRAAPYDANREVDRLPAGAEFFICSRTHDQRWFGIVYPRGPQTLAACGVAAPVARRSDYEGPCASGWVSSAQVRLVSGVPHQLPPGDAPPSMAPPTNAQ
jgi:hypothetical protein